MFSMENVLVKVLILVLVAFLTTSDSGRKPKFQALNSGPEGEPLEALLLRTEEERVPGGSPGNENTPSGTNALSGVDKEKESQRKNNVEFSRGGSTRNDSGQALLETTDVMVAKKKRSSQSSSTRSTNDRVLPVMDSLDHTNVNSLSRMMFYEHHHRDITIFMILISKPRDFLLPVNATHLPGQSLLWIHSEDEILDEFVGREFHPPIISNFSGVMANSKVNGILRRLLAFQYKLNGTLFSLEPDSMYLYNKLERLEPRGAGTQVDVQNIKEVRHLLIEITDDNQKKTVPTYVNLVIVADYTIFKQFKELQKANESSHEEALAEAESYLMALEDLLSASAVASTNETSLHATVAEVLVLKDAENTQFIERARLTKDKVNGRLALKVFQRNGLSKPDIPRNLENSNYVVVVLTRHKVEDEGVKVDGVHSEDLSCRGSSMIISHRELHGTESVMRKFLKNMLTKEAAKRKCENRKDDSSNVCNPMNVVIGELASCKGKLGSETRGLWSPLPIDLHKQCQIAFGPHFVACRAKETICKVLTCKNTADKDAGDLCLSVPFMKALPKTPCGDGRTCQLTNCSSDVKAPSVYEWPVEPVKEDPKTRGISPLELLVLVMMVMALSMLIMGTVLCAMVYKTLAVVRELRHSTKNVEEKMHH